MQPTTLEYTIVVYDLKEANSIRNNYWKVNSFKFILKKKKKGEIVQFVSELFAIVWSM